MDVIVENLISKIQRIRNGQHLSSQEMKAAIKNWLADDVAPVISEFANDDRFAIAANWPLQTLVEGSNSSLRLKIRGLDDELASLADCLHSAADYSLSPRPSATPANRDCRIGDVESNTRLVEFDREAGPPVDEKGLLEQVLVDPDDYWTSTRHNCRNEMVFYGVTTLGDRVTRCFVARLKYCNKKLNETFDDVRFSLDQTSETELDARLAKVGSKATKIRQTCMRKLNGFDEACIVLTQLYAAFARFVDVHWMTDSSFDAKAQKTILANTVLEPVVDLDALDRVVWALSTVSRNLEQLPDPEVAIENAASRFDLVIDLSAKTFYWKGEQFLPKLSPSSWELFSVLAEARKHWNRPVETYDLDSQKGDYRKLKVQKQRLVDSLREQFPDLAGSVIPEGKTYLLSVERKQIVLYTRTVTERIYRLCGQDQTNPISVDVRPKQT